MTLVPNGPELSMPSRQRRGPRVAGWAGIVLHGAAALPYAVSGLVAPPWGVAVLWVLWLLLLGVALRLRVRTPWWTLVVGPGAVVVLIVVVMLGDAVLGWTA